MIQPASLSYTPEWPRDPAPGTTNSLDLADLRGQPLLRRALEVAAAGHHSLLMSGPPGTGKSMAARRLTTIMPPMDRHEQVGASMVYSVRGLLPTGHGLLDRRPFRAPHHTVSTAALVGGGVGEPRPGEVSLAHHGVLYLDELPEFQRATLDAVREPALRGEVTLGRTDRLVRMPAELLLVGSMCRCPCGHADDDSDRGTVCTCSPSRAAAYRDRCRPFCDEVFDLRVPVRQLSFRELAACPQGESSAAVLERVMAARSRMAKADGEALHQADSACEHVSRVSETIAWLAGSGVVTAEHVAEATVLCGGLR